MSWLARIRRGAREASGLESGHPGAWTATMREIAGEGWDDGFYGMVLGKLSGRVESDNVERLVSLNLHARLGIPKEIRPAVAKRLGRAMARRGWRPTHLWIEGEARRVYVRGADGGEPNIRKPGRPAGSKDAKKRTRRWYRRPEGESTWREWRKERGLP
jgi:hypothetical protein